MNIDSLNNMTSEFLDWIVAMDFAHYQTEESTDYKPSGPSHWYINRSNERFTSEDLIKIYTGKMDAGLRQRWNLALTDQNRK